MYVEESVDMFIVQGLDEIHGGIMAWTHVWFRAGYCAKIQRLLRYVVSDEHG